MEDSGVGCFPLRPWHWHMAADWRNERKREKSRKPTFRGSQPSCSGPWPESMGALGGLGMWGAWEVSWLGRPWRFNEARKRSSRWRLAWVVVAVWKKDKGKGSGRKQAGSRECQFIFAEGQAHVCWCGWSVCDVTMSLLCLEDVANEMVDCVICPLLRPLRLVCLAVGRFETQRRRDPTTKHGAELPYRVGVLSFSSSRLRSPVRSSSRRLLPDVDKGQPLPQPRTHPPALQTSISQGNGFSRLRSTP